jgi:glutamyl-tRNA synthetase
VYRPGVSHTAGASIPAKPPSPREITRLAPSPTGALHLGNARTFLITWALARTLDWRILLRIEDLDGPRVKPGVIDLTIDLLTWLGMDWDQGPIIQSADPEPYALAMDSLARAGAAYPSHLTRSEIDAAASAPQEGSHEVRFSAAWRPPITPGPFSDSGTNWRFATPDVTVQFKDALAGPQSHSPAQTIGDFILWTKRAQPSYQLAVVVDDHRQDVTQIVRGDDLLDSAARQLLLYRALRYAPEPTYTHLPLVLGHDGRRLAKRHGDTRLDAYRARGVHPHRVIALLASWCGILDGGRRPARLSAEEFRQRLVLTTIPRSPIQFTPEDDQWLLHES